MVPAALATGARGGCAAVLRWGLVRWRRSVALTVDDDLAWLASRVSWVGDCGGRTEHSKRRAGGHHQ
jgi:hypothetical protein